MLGADLPDDLPDLLLGQRAPAAVLVKGAVQFTRQLFDLESLDDPAHQRQPGAAQAVHMFM